MTSSLSRHAVSVALLLAAISAYWAESSPVERTSPSVARPCDPGSPDSTAWQLVTGKGFTFCLPATWRVEGQTASFKAEKLRWGNGQPTRITSGPVTIGRITSDAAPGIGPPSEAESRRLVDQQLGIQRETEIIDGRRADVSRNIHQGVRNTMAVWDQPRIWISGEAASSEQANAQLMIIRTVRFTQ